MASKIKVDQIEGSTGTSVTIPTGHSFTVTDGLAIGSLPTITVAKGGTNLTSFTAGDVLYATGSTTLAKLAKGTAEQVLAMNSGATAPDWGSVDLTVLPTITVAKGGTNLSSFTAGDILYATGSTTLAKLGKGTARQGLQTNSGATAPEWAASPQSVLTTAGDTLYASSSNTMARLAKGTAAQVMTMNSGATAPEWATAAGGGKLLQVVHNTGNRSANTAGTVVSVAITLASSSNSVWVCTQFDIQRSSGSTTSYGSIKMEGGGFGAGASGQVISGSPLYYMSNESVIGHGGNFLDSSPGSTTPTYGLYFMGGAAFNFAYAQIMAMEIAA